LPAGIGLHWDGANGFERMTVLPQDEVADLSRLVAELEQRLESSFVVYDEAIARQAALAQENARLQSELATAREREAAGAEILRTISEVSDDAERSLQQIVEITARLFGASSVRIRLAEAGGGRAFHVGRSSEAILASVPGARGQIGGRNLPGTVLAENRQIHVADLDHIDPEMSDWPGLPVARAAGTRTISGTPLRRGGNAIGALIIHRDTLLPFTETELALQQSFADQAAIAVENARLFNETQQALERQTATSDILKVIAASPSDAQPVFDAIAASANRLIAGFSTTVFRFIDGQMHLKAFTPTGPAGDELVQAMYPRPLAEFPIFELVEAGETAQFTDTEAESGVAPAIRDLARSRGFRSMLFTPLMSHGLSIGMIGITRPEPGAFADRHVQLLQTFADQAVIAIENVRLFDEVAARTRDLSESLQQQTATAEVLKVISRSTFDLQTVLETLITSAVELSGANRGAIFLREGDVFPLKAASHATPEFLQYWAANPPRAGRGSATERVIASGKIEEIPDVLTDPEMKMTAGALVRIRGTLGVPMLRDDKVEGVLVLTRPEPGPFSKSEIDLVQTFADQAVIAVENVRLFDEAQARTRELAASLEELRTAQDRLVQTEKLASLGQLTAGIAHEIKNPLNFVNNFSSLSAELTDELNDVLKTADLADNVRTEVDELTGLLKDNLQKVVQHGQRADSIVKNMLLHSREGSGDHRPADINALLDESLNLAYHGARAEKPQFNVTLQRDFDSAAGMIELFPQEITRVFLNLIGNAFYAVAKRKAEATEAFDPVVNAATRDLGDRVEIRIRDNGTGIPREVREKMFNPFFTTKPAGEGTGLGLSMSHDIIVKQHGGTIDVETEPGQFTEFTVRLPRTGNIANRK